MKRLFIIAGISSAMFLCSCRKSYTCGDKAGNILATHKGTSKEIKEYEKECNCVCTPD